MRPPPYESPPPPRRRPPTIPESEPFLHRARRVRFKGLLESGLSLAEAAAAKWQEARLRLALARAAGTWRYGVRVVRWLRADVGFCEHAPVRALVDHGRRIVYFDYDHVTRCTDPARDPAVRDEARHIRERRAAC